MAALWLAVFCIAGQQHVLAAGDHEHVHDTSTVLGDPYQEVLALSHLLPLDRNLSYAATVELLDSLFGERLHCADVADASQCSPVGAQTRTVDRAINLVS